MTRLLRPDEVARRLAISRSAVYRMAARGEIPHLRFGRRLVRFDPELLERWLAGRVRGDGRDSG
ncbi:MAG TPA: helix-turn-helix domain-containing protein [Actinomycetota bacterium]|nr:helix-turn-helix domain-containing protein [Actinomycetota bacterium]